MTMRIAIIGAGPAGLLLANYLAHRTTPYEVDVYERRADLRKLSPSDARTFPLALMKRGVSSLEKVPGLLETVEQAAVIVDGACIHQGKKVTTITRPKNISIDRNVLAKVLLDELEKHDGKNPASKVSVKFQTKISKVDFDQKCLKTTNADGVETISQYDCLVACDGSNSLIRRLLVDEGKMSYTEKLTHESYKSMYLAANSDGKESLSAGKIHGWMAGDYRVLGVLLHPNSFSGVFIFPEGKDPLKDFKESSQVYDFLNSNKLTEIADLLSEEEAKALIDRPASTLVSITTDRLHVDDSVLLIGDAAHAVSASMGQGCNSALEDVRIFCDCLDEHGENWSEALATFTNKRLEDAHAVVEMSHYSTPRTAWMRTEFLMRVMMRRFLPSVASQYLAKMPMETMMTGDRKYSEALAECRWWIDRVKASCND